MEFPKKIEQPGGNQDVLYEAETGHELSETERQYIISVLQAHYSDIKPDWHGDKSLGKKYARDNVAATDNQITRGECNIAIDELRLQEGQSLILVGPNGAGKSTLFDAIRGKRNATFANGNYGHGRGFHAHDTIRVSHLDQEELLKNIENVRATDVLEVARDHFQLQFPVDWGDMEVYDQNLANQEAQQRIDELLSQVVKLFEMESFLDREVGQLSGGERTKLALLMTLGSEPDVLLLDEPTNHLDLESIAKLQGLFDNYARAGATIVSSSHVGWYKEQAGKNGVLAIAVDDDNNRSLRYSTSPYVSFIKNKEFGVQPKRPPLEWKDDQKYKFVGQSIFTTEENITVSESPLVDIAMPDITGGDIAVLSGKNGTGKSKLMAEMADRNSKVFSREKGFQTAYLPQTWPDEISQGTVRDFFNWVKSETNAQSNIEASRLTKVIRQMNLRQQNRNVLDQPLANFSGGEQRLLWFAAASLMEGTDVLILDEPTNHMDEQAVEQITQAIRDFPGGVVLSTHDIRLMELLEKDSGNTRQGIKPVNIILEKTNGSTTIARSDKSPSEYSSQVMDEGKKQARRLKLTA